LNRACRFATSPRVSLSLNNKNIFNGQQQMYIYNSRVGRYFGRVQAHATTPTNSAANTIPRRRGAAFGRCNSRSETRSLQRRLPNATVLFPRAGLKSARRALPPLARSSLPPHHQFHFVFLTLPPDSAELPHFAAVASHTTTQRTHRVPFYCTPLPRPETSPCTNP
jgi:hypothetical protein